ncbi:amino acid adenylation domain-containing protein [Spongorhabdus nitratireducens]
MNKSDMDFQATLGGRVLSAAKKYESRPALWAEGEYLSYQEVLQQACSLAQVMPDTGEGRAGEKVGVFASRTSSVYCSLLGVLLAGSCYVPLNPRFPLERLDFIVGRAGIRTLCVDSACEEKAAALLAVVKYECQVILLGCRGRLPAWAEELKGKHKFVLADELPSPERWSAPQSLKVEDLAYLLFTSGTTGQPKGVGVSHGNVGAFLDHMQQTWPLTTEDRCTQIYELAFDVSVNDIFSCWQAGACLYVVPETALLCPSDFVRKHELTCWGSVPSTLGFIKRFNRLKPDYLPSLRLSFFCGEALPVEMAVAWGATAPNSRVINLFGPTEATIAITSYELDRNQVPDQAVMPIGLPFDGQGAVVLNESGEEVTSGEEGELYLAGSQLVAGYWKDEEKTGQTFVEKTVTGHPFNRWYKTGDIASDSQFQGLIFHGRNDFQVKINGYRIELSEIEGVIRELVECSWLAAIPWPVDELTGAASGVVVWVSGESSETADLKQVLKLCGNKLPSYMLPSAIYWMNTLPRNANGKVDIAGLQAATREQEESK